MLRGLALRCDMILFQVKIGASTADMGMELIARLIDERDVPPSDLVVCQLRGRILPVAAVSFADRLVKAMEWYGGRRQPILWANNVRRLVRWRQGY